MKILIDRKWTVNLGDGCGHFYVSVIIDDLLRGQENGTSTEDLEAWEEWINSAAEKDEIRTQIWVRMLGKILAELLAAGKITKDMVDKIWAKFMDENPRCSLDVTEEFENAQKDLKRRVLTPAEQEK